jgi:uncharacterized membrane-anchored protein
MRDTVADNAGGFEELLSKTAKVTVFFWIMKVLATTLGETAGDFVMRRDVEVLFWITALFSNSLGTAFGDLLTSNLGLTFIQGALVTAGVISVVMALHYLTQRNDVLLFWIAFIFTRPFGATFGDLLHQADRAGRLEPAASLGIAHYLGPATYSARRFEVCSSPGGVL